MQARHYQQTAVDSIKLNQVNLCVLPMRAGKSYLIKLIIDEYQFKKVLIVVGYRKIVQQLASYFPAELVLRPLILYSNLTVLLFY